ncbi:peroxin [Actinomortierella ambigua]|nr:peroxin [Actinomortierella ambigua]
MIGAIQGFAQRHRRGLMITAGITGGIYMMGKYAKSKLIEFQEKSAQERTAKENMKRRFEQNQQDCVFTVLSLLPTLGDQLLHELNVELITAKLQQSRSQRPTPQPTPESSMILPPQKKADDPEHVTATTTTTDQSTAEHANGSSTEPASTSTEGQQDESASSSNDSSDGELPNGVEAKVEAEATTPASPASSSSSSPASDDDDNDESDKDKESNGHVSSAEPTGSSESPAETPHEEGKPEEKQEDNKATPNGSIASAPAPAIKVHADHEQQQQPLQQEPTPAATPDAEQPPAIDRRTKLELWNELKTMSFTRTLTALYSLTFLTLLTQLQLNLLGRFTYVSSVMALSSTDPSIRVETSTTSSKGSMSTTNGQLDFQTEKKYLTFSYWVLHEGWRRWNARVHAVVQDIVGKLSLKQSLTAKDFADLLNEIRERLEYTKNEQTGEMERVNMREYILPDDIADEREVLRAGGLDELEVMVEDPVLRSLLDETRDFIDSQDFATVLDKTLTTIFARFHLALQPTFNPFLLAEPRQMIEEIENEDDVDRAVPLAVLLPLVARQVHLIIHGVPNEYVDSLSRVKELQAFSAIIYSSFSEQLVN